MSQIPIVIESHTRSERSYDIYSRLLSDRIIMLDEAVTDATAGAVIAQLMFLESANSSEDIFLYINSPGGSITAGFAILDMMQHVRPDVSTICLGMAASMSSLLLAAGAKGKRLSFPNSEILLHQPMVSGSIQGTAADIQIHSTWLLKTKQKIIRLYSDQTGQSAEKIAKDIERDYFMTAEEAKQYGIVDSIIVAGKPVPTQYNQRFQNPRFTD